MADPEQLAILESGVDRWNRWRKKNPRVLPDLTKSNLLGTNLKYADLKGVDLNCANLSDANLMRADLRAANLWGATLANTYLAYASLAHADLTDADLAGANLTGSDLTHANFTAFYAMKGSNRGRTFLDRAVTEVAVEAANLTGANLTRAALLCANFADADLSDANLTGARLPNTDLSRVSLRGANLSHAVFLGTNIHHVDLSRTMGLEEVIHRGPSPTSSQTLELSKGRIPEKFLRGCGLKDWEIVSAKLHDPDLRADEVIDLTYRIADMRTNSPIVPLSVFISYSHADTKFVEEIEGRFNTDGIRFWRDVHDLTAGPLDTQIDRAIDLQKAVLLVLSESSVDSEWVKLELSLALKAGQERTKESRKRKRTAKTKFEVDRTHVLCPVALDDSWKHCDWPMVLKHQMEQYFVLDFSDWEKDAKKLDSQYEKLKAGLGIYYK